MKRTLRSAAILLTMLAVGAWPQPTLAQQPPPICLADTSWDGSETLAGYGDLTFHFHADGAVTMSDADGESCGTWRQCGCQVTLAFHGGRVIYSGTVSGDCMWGTARNCRTCWRWNLQQQ